MKFGKRYSHMTVFMAMIHGIVIGILAIIVVGLVFVGAEGKRPVDDIEKEIPTAGPEKSEKEQSNGQTGVEPVTLYAKQHGAFTNSASAATFIADDSSLSTAAIVQGDNQFFVWSAVGRTEPEIEGILDGQTYKKTFTVEALKCEQDIQQVWDIFQSDDLSKIKNSISEKDGKEAEDLMKKMEAITAFTDDLKVIRLHLLAKYVNDDDCMKISF